MEAWKTILLALGGNAALFAVLGLLSKSLIEKLLTRDTQRFEYELKCKADTELEKLRSSLATIATEHQIRFAKLHERRAEVIAETYSKLRDLHTSLGDYVKPFVPTGDKSQEERRKIVGEAHKKFIEYYSRNRIFLSKVAVEKLDAINLASKKAFFDFFYSIEMTQASGVSDPNKWNEIFGKVNKDMPAVLEELEGEFRKLLGNES